MPMLRLSPLAASARLAQTHAQTRGIADALVWAVVSGLAGATLILAVMIVRTV
ncbi:MAG: hypothetical protein AB7K35_12270 [Pseudorhodoplanes sp.]